MQITFDPVNLSDGEREILLAILDVRTAAAPAPAPAKKAAPKAKPAPVVVEEEVVIEEEEEEDVLGTTVTKEDAVAAATKLVSEGKQQIVKAALANVGAKRVSEIKDADLARFVDELSAA